MNSLTKVARDMVANPEGDDVHSDKRSLAKVGIGGFVASHAAMGLVNSVRGKLSARHHAVNNGLGKMKAQQYFIKGRPRFTSAFAKGLLMQAGAHTAISGAKELYNEYK